MISTELKKCKEDLTSKIMKKIFLLLVLAILLISCNKENNNPSELVDVKYINNSDLFNCLSCFSPSNLSSKGFIIKDEDSYNRLADSLRFHVYYPNLNCDTATLKQIDFNAFSLIGIVTSYGMCDSISKSILANSNRTKITYNIIIKEYSGFCIQILCVSLNFALVPKIPDDCTVNFYVKTER